MTEASAAMEDHEARAMANEARQMVESFNRLWNSKWEDYTRRLDAGMRIVAENATAAAARSDASEARLGATLTEIKAQITDAERTYSNRFWTLAITIIAGLIAALWAVGMKLLH